MTTHRPPGHPRRGDAVASLLADTDPYLSCEECFDRLDQYVEQLLRDPASQDVAMRTHLLACAACAEEADSLLELISG
ncbi:MAG TPA: hypothetical protein VFK41_06855 [Nocardioidaceae bacterium]|nr:hypothetical protein [Nocardioidaceae bacterium]